MKKLLFSLLTLAAALTVTSCLKDVDVDPGYDDGIGVNASFFVQIGPQATKAFADGSQANQLYAGLYMIDNLDDPSTWTYVAHTATAISVVGGKAQVEFPAQLKLKKYYEVVFWAQKEGAPYTVDWAENATSGPIVTVTPTGPANDDSRDAFCGSVEFGPVTGAVTIGTEDAPGIELMRPFAQVNVLVHNDNVIDLLGPSFPEGGRVSSMTITGVPTKLNLVTGATSDPANYVFAEAPINEAAFGTLSNEYQYMAMNYVLFGPNSTYPVTFSVTNTSQSVTDLVANVPLKPNVRTNLIGNIFDENFNFSGWVVVTPQPGELTQINVEAGVGADAENAVQLTYNSETPVWTTVNVTVSHKITKDEEKPSFEYDPDGVAEARWIIDDENEGTGHLEVKPLVENGSTKITVTFPPVTKTTSYSEASMDLFVKVGTGVNPAPAAKTLSSIAVTTNPTKTTYTVNEEFDPTGMVVTATYSDESTAPVTGYTTNAADVLASAGENKDVTVTYTESEVTKTATFKVTVNAAPAPAQKTLSSIAVTTNPTKTTYTVNEEFDPTGMVVTATYSDESTAPVTGYTTNAADVLASAGENKDVTVTYTESEVTKTATFKVTVNAAPTSDFTTIAGLKALLGAESATFTGTLTDAVVTFIAGTSDAVIKDATGSILYHKESGHGLLQGQTISGDVIAEAVIYNGINEITDLAATVKGEESAVEPEVVTFAQLAADYATYESAYVKVVGVTSNTTTKKGNIEATQDGTNYIVYTNVAIPVNTGDVFTAEGTVTKYNTTEELKVWKAADLTVTAAAPVLSATPAATTVAATATSVTWTISSNTDWTITPGTGVTASATSGNGNADVTLTFAANTGSSAVTYTATASATGCDDVTITITQSAAGSSSDITDTITSALLTATSTTYTDFSNVAATSSARYAGNSAKSSSGGIQMRSKNSNSGIVSTVSGGRVKSVTITVESGSNAIDVYGSNTAYTGAGDLYATGEGGNQGTKIGTLNATGTITFTDDYAYVGIRSNSGAIYVTSVEIVWE